jgi:hypothetical protein
LNVATRTVAEAGPDPWRRRQGLVRSRAANDRYQPPRSPPHCDSECGTVTSSVLARPVVVRSIVSTPRGLETRCWASGPPAAQEGLAPGATECAEPGAKRWIAPRSLRASGVFVGHSWAAPGCFPQSLPAVGSAVNTRFSRNRHVPLSTALPLPPGVLRRRPEGVLGGSARSSLRVSVTKLRAASGD